MDWTAYFNGFWIFPLFCLLFMALMMLGCRGMSFRCGRDRSKEAPQDRSTDDGARKWQR